MADEHGDDLSVARSDPATLRFDRHGVLTERPGVLTNDFFVNLLDLGVEWRRTKGDEYLYEAVDRACSYLFTFQRDNGAFCRRRRVAGQGARQGRRWAEDHPASTT